MNSDEQKRSEEAIEAAQHFLRNALWDLRPDDPCNQFLGLWLQEALANVRIAMGHAGVEEESSE